MSDSTQLHQAIPYHGSDQLHIGNGQGLPITSSRHLTILNIPKPLHLKNILHVPEINKNLLSVHKFSCDNIYFKFHSDCCLVKDKENERVLLKGTPKDGLYHLTLASTLPQAFIGKKNLSYALTFLSQTFQFSNFKTCIEQIWSPFYSYY